MNLANNIVLTGKVKEISDYTNPDKTLLKVVYNQEEDFTIKVVVPKQVLNNEDIKVGDLVVVDGYVSTKNKTDEFDCYIYAESIKWYGQEDINKVFMICTVESEPVFKTIGYGGVVTFFARVDNENIFPIVAWDDIAKAIMHKNIKIGDRVVLSGKINTHAYKKASDEETYQKYLNEVNIDQFKLLSDEVKCNE